MNINNLAEKSKNEIDEIHSSILAIDDDENDKLCNELDRSDCVNVANHKIKIIMKGEPKIYIQYTNNNSSSILYLSMWLFALVLLYI